MNVDKCSCDPGDGCNGEGYEPDDSRVCVYCRDLDGEMSCPADPAAYDFLIENLIDDVAARGDEWDGNVVCADGTEPFASVDLGHGLVIDFTAKVRRA